MWIKKFNWYKKYFEAREIIYQFFPYVKISSLTNYYGLYCFYINFKERKDYIPQTVLTLGPFHWIDIDKIVARIFLNVD